jgi:transcriptional repressor NF-X1
VSRPFSCGAHFCTKPCHPPSPAPLPCPRSPSLITHCPCGKHAFTSDVIAFQPGTQLSRTKCSNPIPTCTSTCMRPLASCTHICSVKCHAGPCPPCSIMLVRPCRCGATTKSVRCSGLQNNASITHGEILCDRPCAALRACGRHQCNRVCCPLAALVKGKGKKRGATDVLGAGMVDDAGLHDCDLVCGKMLGCGNHRCEERDHRGGCPPCLRSTFEEVRASRPI